MKSIYLSPVLILITILVGCSSTDNSCEDITLATEQIHECKSLQRQIANSKEQPLIRTELERRYQVDCIDMRYYRDDKQTAICGNKHKVDKVIDAVAQESKQ